MRKKYSEIRKNVENKSDKSTEIFNTLIQDESYKNSASVAFFVSIASEVDTSQMINHALLSGKKVLLPRVCGSNLNFYRYSNDLRLEKSRFGVPEPPDDKSIVYPAEKIDLVIVPGLCFDEAKNRLGYGGGFYDRFLNSHKTGSIAVCFDEQIAQRGVLPVCETDVKVNKIITDKRIII